MSAENNESPIIIKKINKGHGHHGGAWKVAYADFVTAMMALFIVLWILGQDEEVIQNVAGYFRDPIGFSDKIKSFKEGNSLTPGENNSDSSAIKNSKEEEILELKKMGDKILGELSSSPEFANLLDQVKIEVVDEGLRIEMVESNDDVFFEIGTANMKDEGRKLLEKIGQHLLTLPNKLIVEGHTDSRPYSTSGLGYSNYELSADRANSARRVLVSTGIENNRFDEIRGYADKKLLDKEDPFNLVNRRISIIIKFAEGV